MDPAERPATARAFREALSSYEQHRASLALTASADERLARVEQLVAGAAGLDAPQVYQMINEARFACQQALQQWSGNPAARQGLQRCLEVTVRHELRRGDPAAARSALAVLTAPRPDLEAEIVRLELAQRGAAREQARFRQLAHDVDPSVAQRLRVGLMIGYGTLMVVAVVLAYAVDLHRTATTRDAATLASAFLLSCVGVLVAVRRRLLVNAFNRWLAAWFILLVSCVVANRLVGLHLELSLDRVLAVDMFVQGALCGAAGILLGWWLWLGAGLSFGGALLALAFPGAAAAVYPLVVMLIIGLPLVFWRRAS